MLPGGGRGEESEERKQGGSVADVDLGLKGDIAPYSKSYEHVATGVTATTRCQRESGRQRNER